MAKVIISCAVTGAIHTPSMSAALPVTPEEIAAQSVDAVAAGAAILHLHARKPDTGEPTGDPEVFRRFLPAIKERCDAVINITTGGSVAMTVEERLAAALAFAPEMCSLNMGSMNFGLYPAAKRDREWKFPWEKPYLLASDDYIFRNTFRDIDFVLRELGARGTRFEHECYDVGHLYTMAHYLDRGLIKPGFFVQMVFGVLGGIGADLDNLFFMHRTAERLFGKNTYEWSVLAAGRHQMPFVTQAALLGGNVRVGLEDSLYIGPGQLAASNAQQVEKIVRILGEMGHEPATPSDVRQRLGLRGAGGSAPDRELARSPETT